MHCLPEIESTGKGPSCRSCVGCSALASGPIHHTVALAVLAADVDAFNLLLEMKLKRRRERPNLPRTVTQLVAEDGSRVYVVGTAHFSDDSKRDVVKVSTAPLPFKIDLLWVGDLAQW